MAKQGNLFSTKGHEKTYRSITYAYRVSLVRDRRVRFSSKQITDTRLGAEVIRETISACGQSDRENAVVIMLNAKNEISGTNIVSQGCLDRSIVTMREMFKPAIIANAAAVILGHNHPSGRCDPSEEDRQLTKLAKDAGKLLGIRVLDHIIVSQNGDGYYSFLNNGLM